MIEPYLVELRLAREPGLDVAMRYPLAGGGKRIRPRLCLAAARAGGADPAVALPAAAAIELIHTFSLVHDDLPALDDDDERRGRPSLHTPARPSPSRRQTGPNAATAGALTLRPGRLLVVASCGDVAGMITASTSTSWGPWSCPRASSAAPAEDGSLTSAAVACGLPSPASTRRPAPYRAFAAGGDSSSRSSMISRRGERRVGVCPKPRA